MTDNLEVPIPQGWKFALTVDPAYSHLGTQDLVFVGYVSRARLSLPMILLGADSILT